MAEGTPTTHNPTGNPASSSGSQHPKAKQYIRATANDDSLEPDALRGNENIIKELGIDDEEAERRKAIEKKEDK